MPKMEWGAVGQRFFETGIDRGVLYPLLGMGVPWDGLVSVTEKAAGGEPKPYYYDGFKYLNLSADQEFEATISAYSAPRQFDKCDGSAAIQNGLLITQQRRESFGFSYRTRIGNDVDGATHGYKIHLVYNALAGPSDREHQSLNDSVSPMTLSWSITTAPPQITGYKPSAHLVIDSRYTPPALLAEVEAMLYGTDDADPYLPDQQDLMDLMTSSGPIVSSNLVLNPLPVGTFGASVGGQSRNLTYDDVDGFIKSTRLDGTGNVVLRSKVSGVESSSVYTIMGIALSSVDFQGTISLRIDENTTNMVTAGQIGLLANIPTEFRFVVTSSAAAYTAAQCIALGGGLADASQIIGLKNLMLVPGNYLGPYYDGNSPDDGIKEYNWADLPNQSITNVNSWW